MAAQGSEIIRFWPLLHVLRANVIVYAFVSRIRRPDSGIIDDLSNKNTPMN
jgi:hypothetical protein